MYSIKMCTKCNETVQQVTCQKNVTGQPKQTESDREKRSQNMTSTQNMQQPSGIHIC